jgi:hypothetical protein
LTLPLLLLLLHPTAAAADVQDGVQVVLFPNGMAFIEDQLAASSFDIVKSEVSAPTDCFDLLGVRDFNLTVPVEAVTLNLGEGSLRARISFGEIRGEDMQIFGEDEDWFDDCYEFSGQLDFVSLVDGELDVALTGTTENGVLQLAVDGEPTLTGTLDFDIDNFPDNTIIDWFNEEMVSAIGTALAAKVPDIAEVALVEPLEGADWAGWSVGLSFDGIDSNSDRLRLDATPSVAWTGPAPCVDESRENTASGRSEPLTLAVGDTSALAIGLTERMLNELLLSAWRGGWFCFDSEQVQDIVTLVQGQFDPAVGGLSGTVALGKIPSLTLSEAGAAVSLPGIELSLEGTLDGQAQPLLDVTADVGATLAVGVNAETTTLTLSVHDLVFDVRSLEARHLVSDEAFAEQQLRRFLEQWLATWIESQAQDLVLFSTLYEAFGSRIRVDDIDAMDGGIAVFLSLFASDDPLVDVVAPTVEIGAILPLADGTTVLMLGEDDRPGDLTYSVQVDGLGWSQWAAGGSATLGALDAGEYSVDVKARDAWLNESAVVSDSFTVAATATDEGTGCGCSSRAAGSRTAGLLLVVLGMMVGRRAKCTAAAR